MSAKFKACATTKGQPLIPFSFDPGPLGIEQVIIKVGHLVGAWGCRSRPDQ